MANGLVVEAKGGLLQLQRMNGKSTQIFRPVICDDGLYRITTHSEEVREARAWDIAGCEVETDVHLCLYEENESTPSQQFKFVPFDDAIDYQSQLGTRRNVLPCTIDFTPYNIRLFGSGYNVSVMGKKLVSWEADGSNHQQFQIEFVSQGSFHIINMNRTMAVSVSDYGAAPALTLQTFERGKNAQTFCLCSETDGYSTIKTTSWLHPYPELL